jgi:hypothetical protein
MSSTLTRLTVVALGAWLAAACSGQIPVGPSLQVEALSTADGTAAAATSAAAAAPLSARGSWNGWHVHDLPPGAAVYTEENGLTHLGFAVFPQIFDDYATTPSLHAYCPDGVDKGLVGGDGGSKIASGTCQNEDTLIHLKNQANDAPAPAESSGWTALPPGPSFTVYYRLTPR